MSKNLNGSFFTTKSLNGENDIEINKSFDEKTKDKKMGYLVRFFKSIIKYLEF